VQGNKLTDSFGRKPFEESPKRGLVWKARKPQQRKECSIVLEDFGLVDSPKTSHDNIQKSHNHIGGKIVCLALRDLGIML